MRHAAHKSPKGGASASPKGARSGGASGLTKSLFAVNDAPVAHHASMMAVAPASHAGSRADAPVEDRPARHGSRGGHGAHAARPTVAVSAVNGIATLDESVLEKINEVAPQTRRAIRQAARAAQRRNTLLTSASLAALVGTAATSLAFANSDNLTTLTVADGETTTTSTITRADDGTSAANRSTTRTSLTSDNVQATDNDGDWNLGDSNAVTDTDALSASIADNPLVAQYMEADGDAVPDTFNPNHDSGDIGNSYPYGQCTWWAYTRRHQLGLPMGSYFGNAQNWTASATSRGYWVDNTPRHQGDVVVFAPGQAGASTTYGHVAVVESVADDGSITISESNVAGLGVITNRTFTAAEAAQFSYIHY
ncbi:CHAP domain-containing protein [Bifidobacterium choloepi]|uniref:CHAP domain-containing protein n=1 Tax=Bifidobacterium choloepi TaxID=2614131 RepID=A0A6I5MZD7_9BIFI|nr:CHAP domain-containing protein [Bifidobacterium choloepi]NEG69576.1 CHAP domain-containing protein [Bifidobacterium choloepi]